MSLDIYTPQLPPFNQRTHRDVIFESFRSCVTEDQVFWFETLFIWADIFSKLRKILVPSSSKSSSLLDISDTEYERTTIRQRGTRWHSRLNHCATSRKVAGSIPYVVIGIFHYHNLSGCTMALGLTQPLTEMSTRNTVYSRI